MPEFNMRKRLGWKPEPPDSRDLLLGVHFRQGIQSVVPLPRKVSLREKQTEVRDQEETNSCTGFALAAFREYLEVTDKGKPGADVTSGYLSALFIYNKEREMAGIMYEDQGAYIRDGLKVLQKHGVLPEPSFSFSPKNMNIVPLATEESRKNCIYSYLRVTSIDEVKSALALGLPVVCGLTIYENWDLPIVTKYGMVPDPQGKPVGGHAVLIVGYDDNIEKLTYKNSWGKDWGDKGYFHTDYKYLMQNGDDLWTILKWR